MEDRYDDKIVKLLYSYLDELLKDWTLNYETQNSLFNGGEEIWFGLGREINGSFRVHVGCHKFGDVFEPNWYYDGEQFTGVDVLFDLSRTQFNRLFKDYLIKKYNVEIGSLC